jgi:hypothetical protein
LSMSWKPSWKPSWKAERRPVPELGGRRLRVVWRR